MKYFKLFVLILFSIYFSACSNTTNNLIKTTVPARQLGQKSVLGLALPPIDTVRVGFIGLGMRGPGAVQRFTYIPGTKIVALCDLDSSNVSKCQKYLTDKGLPKAAEYYGGENEWKKLCDRNDIDLVYICTDWKHHVPIALYSMDKGKNVAVEVPAASTLDDIWALVDKAEQTQKHCMMLENCCYDFYELNTINMAHKGILGEILHVEGAYLHNLEPYWHRYWNNWRLNFNQEVRGDVYPTHGIGPICQALNIHRGDRMTKLISVDTKPCNGPKLVEANTGKPCSYFANGDQTSTLITTELGKTMLIEHDVMTPRPYSRMYQLVGSNGYVSKYPSRQMCLRGETLNNKDVEYDNLESEVVLNDAQIDSMLNVYRSPILTPQLEDLAKKVGGHGGMDFIMDYRLVYCLHNGLPLDMDVYDLAEWCCVVPLSRISLEHGNAPVDVPDFTRGDYKKKSTFEYALKQN